MSHKLNVTYNLFSSFICFAFGVFFLFFFVLFSFVLFCFVFFFCGMELMGAISGKQIY